MNTWEIIKEFTIDRTKEFESKDHHGNKVIAKLVEGFESRGQEFDAIVLFFSDGDEQVLECSFGGNGNGGILTWFWEEVTEPVDFMTAWNDCDKTGRVYKRGCVEMQYNHNRQEVELTWSQIVDKNITIGLGGEWFKEVN